MMVALRGVVPQCQYQRTGCKICHNFSVHPKLWILTMGIDNFIILIPIRMIAITSLTAYSRVIENIALPFDSSIQRTIFYLVTDIMKNGIDQKAHI